MSTKLYSGLKLRDSSADLFELIPRIAEAIRSAFAVAAEELVARELVDHIDGLRPDAEREESALLIFEVEDRWKTRQQKLGAHHALNDPLRFSIVFGRSDRGNILAYPYYWDPAYRDALNSLELFDDYHYQDQSDRPDGISEADWDARGDEWDSLINTEGSFGDLPLWQLGTSMEPFSQVYLGSKRARDFDVNRLISPEQRLSGLLQRALLARAQPELDPSREMIFRLASEARGVVMDRLKEDAEGSIARPAALPAGLSFRYSELAPYEADPALMEELFAELTRRLAG